MTWIEEWPHGGHRVKNKRGLAATFYPRAGFDYDYYEYSYYYYDYYYDHYCCCWDNNYHVYYY